MSLSKGPIASQTASASDALPLLYSFRRCPYAMRARMALAVSGVPHAACEVRLRDKPGALLAASPKGTVPVLVLPSGRVLEHSLDIMLWALQHNDPGGWLSPDTGTLADMTDLLARAEAQFKPALDRYKYPNRFGIATATNSADGSTDRSVNSSATQHRDSAALWLHGVEARLAAHVGLFGMRLGLADFGLLPFVRQFAHVNPDWFAGQDWPHLQRWLANWQASALYAQIMRKDAAH
jgi:glutathione S-transferase